MCSLCQIFYSTLKRALAGLNLTMSLSLLPEGDLDPSRYTHVYTSAWKPVECISVLGAVI